MCAAPALQDATSQIVPKNTHGELKMNCNISSTTTPLLLTT
jgi:hypothetical protein